jgi:hypothetical protein
MRPSAIAAFSRVGNFGENGGGNRKSGCGYPCRLGFQKKSPCIVLVAALPRDTVMGFGVAVDFAYCQLLIAGRAERG